MRQRVLQTLRAELTWRASRPGRGSGRGGARSGPGPACSLGAERTDQVGPLLVSSEVRLSLTGNTVLDVPPLGTIELDTHDGPLALHAQVVALDADVTEDAIAGGVPDTDLDDVPGEVRCIGDPRLPAGARRDRDRRVVGSPARLAPTSVGTGHCRGDCGSAGAERWHRCRHLGGPRPRPAPVHGSSGLRSSGRR